ncbi:MAG: hypothetical protein KGH57_01310 [Candidatus Micrarchaeota archaeon]|nr:hypothetical protein [Candidatus Micrarchaeota archaeon]
MAEEDPAEEGKEIDLAGIEWFLSSDKKNEEKLRKIFESTSLDMTGISDLVMASWQVRRALRELGWGLIGGEEREELKKVGVTLPAPTPEDIERARYMFLAGDAFARAVGDKAKEDILKNIKAQLKSERASRYAKINTEAELKKVPESLKTFAAMFPTAVASINFALGTMEGVSLRCPACGKMTRIELYKPQLSGGDDGLLLHENCARLKEATRRSLKEVKRPSNLIDNVERVLDKYQNSAVAVSVDDNDGSRIEKLFDVSLARDFRSNKGSILGLMNGSPPRLQKTGPLAKITA